MRLALLLVGGCVSPAIEVAHDPQPAVCAQAALPGIGTSSLEVVATPLGATMIWIDGGVRALRLDPDTRAVGDAALAWPGTFDRASVATIGDQVIVGAVAGDWSWMLAAPLGLPPYRELGILGGLSGESPVVVAGGQRLATTVSYGGMQVNELDATWTPKTSLQMVLTGSARDVAATALGGEAIVVWPTEGACHVARLFDAANGASTTEAVTCGAPRLAASALDVGLVFERDGGVYFARAAASELSPANAVRIGDGRAPRLVAVGDRYWVSYLDATGALVAGWPDQLVEVAPAATAHELAIVGGMPRVFAANAEGVAVSTMCVD